MIKLHTMRIVAPPGVLQEGLFGQVVLWVFEILPWLRAQGIESPRWHICSKHYGLAPHFKIIPGIFVPRRMARTAALRVDVDLMQLRQNASSILGGDFRYAHTLWSNYFSVPKRILKQAQALKITKKTLGLHYRGNDKNTSTFDTNPVTPEDFLTLAKDFLKHHPKINKVYVATDEPKFKNIAQSELRGVTLIFGTPHGFHKRRARSKAKAESALLDCVALSRCRYVLQCSSALSAFAKVLNPSLESYRVSASKAFAEFPYFPVAYIPPLVSKDSRCKAILKRQLRGDWLHDRGMRKKYLKPFGARANPSTVDTSGAHRRR